MHSLDFGLTRKTLTYPSIEGLVSQSSCSLFILWEHSVPDGMLVGCWSSVQLLLERRWATLRDELTMSWPGNSLCTRACLNDFTPPDDEVCFPQGNRRRVVRSFELPYGETSRKAVIKKKNKLKVAFFFALLLESFVLWQGLWEGVVVVVILIRREISSLLA